MPTCNLINIHCHVPDESDLDEVYLKYNGKKIWPSKRYRQLKPGATPVETEIKDLEREGFMEIELWDYDFLSRNDLLGKFRMPLDQAGGPFTTDLTKEGNTSAAYTLEWEFH